MNALRLYLFAHYLGLGALLPLLALGLEARGFRPSQYGWLLALIPLSRLFAPPLWGALADRQLGTSKLLCINTAGAALAMLTLFLLDGFVVTVVGLGCWALFTSSLMPLVEASTYRLLGRAAAGFGYVRVFGSLGFACAALGMGTLGVDAQVRAPFGVAAAGYLIAYLAARTFRDSTRPTRAPLTDALRVLASRVDVWLLWLGTVSYYVAHGAFDSYFGPFARTIPGVRPETVSSAWALGVTCEVIVLWFVPRWLEGRARSWLLVGSGCCAVLRWALLAAAREPGDLWVQQPLHAITFGVWYLAFVHENQASAPDAIRATVQGVAQACLGAGMIVATLLGGYLFEALGGRALFQAATAAALLAVLCYTLRQVLLARGGQPLADARTES